MFRISQYLKEVQTPTPLGPKRHPPGPVVIWNLIRQCNLACKHCYTNSADKVYEGELSTGEVFSVMEDLKRFRVPVLILSGGEPLMRPDIFDIAKRSKDMGFYTGLSTNGTRITQENIERIVDMGFDYVGVSLDGIGKTHDLFRRKDGAFDEAMTGIKLCKEKGLKVGLRFTLTQDNHHSLKDVVGLLEEYDLDKFYMSHLNYSGRGKINQKDDAYFEVTRQAMDFLFEEAWKSITQGTHREFVTGNNDADGVYLLHWVRKHFPQSAAHVQSKLEQWGGNSTGINIANIDNLGNVHPDSFWWDYNLGNVRQRPFSAIWNDLSDPLMAGLKKTPRTIEGRCGQCHYFGICNGNTRVRAYQTSKNFWAEDPGCYLSDSEIGLTGTESIHANTP